MRDRLSRIIAVVVVGLLPIVAARAEGPVTIRYGAVDDLSPLTPIFYDKPDIMPHLGKTYTVEFVHFAGSAPAVTAFATGDIQVTGLAYSSFGAVLENARLDDLRIVADAFQGGTDGYFANPFVVAKDGNIKTVEDLKGKVVAVNAIGGASDMAVRAMLRIHHLEDKRDLTIIEAQFPNMVSMLIEKKVDLISTIPVVFYDPRLQQSGRVLFTQADALGPTQNIFLVAREGFLAKSGSALSDFFEDTLIGLRWFSAPAHRAEAIRLIAQHTKQPPERIADWILTKGDYYRDPKGRPNMEALQHNLETQRQLGFLKTDIRAAQYADFTYIDAAAKRLSGNATSP